MLLLETVDESSARVRNHACRVREIKRVTARGRRILTFALREGPVTGITSVASLNVRLMSETDWTLLGSQGASQ